MRSEDFQKFSDEDIYREAARRLKCMVEQSFGEKFTFGEVVFAFHNGQFVRIDVKPSMRAYVNPEGSSNTRGQGAGRKV